MLTTVCCLPLVVALATGVVITPTTSGNQVDATLPYHVTLDSNYQLYWEFNATHITFQTVVNTTGYVALGISGNGNMFPADVIVGWVKDGVTHFFDGHTTAHVAPVKDSHQDWHLISGSETSGVTSLKFTRKLETCDDEDKPILEGTTRVIFSYHSADPADETTLPYHGPNRGSKSILLLDPPASESKSPPSPSSVKTIDFLNGNVSIPGKDTYYHCTTFKLPDLGGKHHMYRYEPVVQPGHENLVHHIIISYCVTPPDSSFEDIDFECYTEKPPQLLYCYSALVAWAIGGQAFDFPAHVGYPLGTDADPSFFIMETHYNNPGLRTDFVDNSGLRISLTSDIRQYDAGLIQVGMVTNEHQIVPPLTPEFLSTAYCPAECLSSSLKNDEIHVFANMLHSHLIGFGIKTRVIRQGKELPPLAQDNNYDFNYQEMRRLPNEYTIKSGDSFIVECLYKAPNRTQATYGGLGTKDEMCLSFVMYYPRTPLSLCMTDLSYQTPPGYRHMKEWVDSQDWTNKDNHGKFQNMTDSAAVTSMCLGDKRYQSIIYKPFTQSALQPNVKYEAPTACP